MKQLFEAIDESRPGPKWCRLFDRHGPARQRRLAGLGAPPSLADCRRAVAHHLPLWQPIWDELVACVRGGDAEARVLSGWCPPPETSAGTLAVWFGTGGPVLLRNHDHGLATHEGAWLRTRWGGQRVLAMSEALCGALDGINESGLAAALCFGGRRERRDGFGAPLVLRYLLEFASTTREAVALLRGIPVSMTHSIVLLDRLSNATTVFIAPDREAQVVPLRGVANHQHGVEWPEYANATHSRARCRALARAMAEAATQEEMVAAMLTPPLFQNAYRRGHGTLYTSVYGPQALQAELAWQTGGWLQSVEAFREGVRQVALVDEAEESGPPDFGATVPGWQDLLQPAA